MESNFLSIFGKKIMSYIRPQKEKKINIPLHILAKYYARLYTYEDIGFYPKMNKDLTNKKFDLYRTYIFLLYNGIHKKTLKIIPQVNFIEVLHYPKKNMKVLKMI